MITKTNEELAQLGLATVDTTPPLVPAVTVFDKNGKSRGTVQAFSPHGSAKELNALAKASGLTGKKAEHWVNAILRGETDLRQQLGIAWLQSKFQDGYTCGQGKLTKSGDSGALELIRVTPAPVVVAPKPVEMSAEEMAEKAKGMSKPERDAILKVLLSPEAFAMLS
jgi:hypothetical protein